MLPKKSGKIKIKIIKQKAKFLSVVCWFKTSNHGTFLLRTLLWFIILITYNLYVRLKNEIKPLAIIESICMQYKQRRLLNFMPNNLDNLSMLMFKLYILLLLL